MTVATRDRAAAIFLALSSVPPEDRARVLDERCGGDAVLRDEVGRLLRRLEASESLPGPPARAAAGDEALPQPAGTVIGGFAVVRRIGAGATGVVYLAQQAHPSRIVALKVLKHEFVASVVQRRFEIEAELLGRLQHPGIAQIYAAHPGDDTTPPFIAMELVNGPAITTFVENHQVQLRDRVELVARVCDAVQHAHQRGIIHRDLKPGNILVDESGQPKVVDFGVARIADAQATLTTIETQAGQLVGTLAYMSPEQVQADPHAIDTRTDIHALGVILFRLLTGRLPFAHDDPPLPELARRIVQDNPPRLSEFNQELKGDLEIIVSRALAKEKERRYPSAASVAGDLRRYVAGQPISASADSAWYLVRRQVGRYRLALGLSAAVVVALAALTVYAIVQRARATEVNVRLEAQLARSTIERGLLLSRSGNLPSGEKLVWRELFRQPDSRQAQWALWDIYSRERSTWIGAVHERGTLVLRFSPDNRRLLTAGRYDGLMQLFDVESHQIIRSFVSNPRSGTVRAFFTPDGTTIVAGSADGSIRLWDIDSGAVRRVFPKAAPGLQDLALTADGRSVVTVASGKVQTWSLDDGRQSMDLSDLLGDVNMVATSPTGTLVLAGGSDGTVTMIDLARRSRLWQARGHDGRVSSVGIAPQGRWATSGGYDGVLHVWNAATGERVRTLPNNNGTVRNFAFDAAGALLAVSGWWRTRIYNLEEPAEPPRDFGLLEGASDVHMSTDGRLLATCDAGTGQVRMWNLGADSRTDHWAGTRAVTGLLVARDGRSIVTAAGDGVVARWHVGQASGGQSFPVGPRVGGLATSQDGRWLVSVGHPGTAAVWDALDGRRTFGLPDLESARAVVFADDDRRLVAGDIHGVLTTWDWSDAGPRNPRQTERPAGQEGEVLALAARGQRLIAAHRNRTIDVRETGGRVIRTLQASAAPFSLAISPDGRLLAAGTWIATVDVWEIESGRKLDELRGQAALITGVDFSPDGRLLAASSRDGSTQLWDAASGQWLAVVASRKAGAERVRFFPDGNRLAIGYEDGEIEVRDLQYFFRYAAAHAEHQLRLFQAAGETFPRAGEVLDWSRRILSTPRQGALAGDGGPAGRQ